MMKKHHPHINQQLKDNLPMTDISPERQRWTVFIDGASRGNPGKSGIGIYITDHQQKEIFKKGFFIGNNKTNNQAEYYALLFALLLINNLSSDTAVPRIRFISDSELLIKQMNGLYKIKNPILAYLKSLIDSMLKNLTYEFKHVLRQHNVVADALANDGIDKKTKLPAQLLAFSSQHNLM